MIKKKKKKEKIFFLKKVEKINQNFFFFSHYPANSTQKSHHVPGHKMNLGQVRAQPQVDLTSCRVKKKGSRFHPQ